MPSRDAPANVVGQVEQEFLPRARTGEAISPFPGLQCNLLKLGIYISEGLAR